MDEGEGGGVGGIHEDPIRGGPQAPAVRVWGPARGYFPEPTKSILVVSEKNVPRANAYFRGMGIKVVTGSRYLGGYMRELEA